MSETTPKRIQRKRTRGWRMPPNAVCVTRPTMWGNPFTHDDPAQAVAAYRRLVTGGGSEGFEMGPNKLRFARNAHSGTLHYSFPQFVRDNLHSLRGKDLACYCKPGDPCHADVLLELANA